MSNVNPHPDVSDEDIGRRQVEVRRGKAVERALERLRKGLGQDWKKLKVSDIEKLRWALGELWSHIPHSQWEDLRFSSRNLEDVGQLLEMSTELAKTHKPGPILDRMGAALA